MLVSRVAGARPEPTYGRASQPHIEISAPGGVREAMNSLSGALNPIEAMPKWLQPFTVPNPIHHFATVVRASMMKGSGIDTLWPNFLALFLFTFALVALSVWRFRKQLS